MAFRRVVRAKMVRDRQTDPSRLNDRSSRSAVSVALLAGIAFMPIVIAAGFLTDGSAMQLPGDISIAALRGGLDRALPERPFVSRAGF